MFKVLLIISLIGMNGFAMEKRDDVVVSRIHQSIAMKKEKSEEDFSNQESKGCLESLRGSLASYFLETNESKSAHQQTTETIVEGDLIRVERIKLLFTKDSDEIDERELHQQTTETIVEGDLIREERIKLLFTKDNDEIDERESSKNWTEQWLQEKPLNEIKKDE